MIDMFSCVCTCGGFSIKCCISYFILSVEKNDITCMWQVGSKWLAVAGFIFLDILGLADDTILDEGPYISECVGANPTFLAQVISILGLLKIFF
jgi:hypothetical protein